MRLECPKCGRERRPGLDECPRCGVYTIPVPSAPVRALGDDGIPRMGTLVCKPQRVYTTGMPGIDRVISGRGGLVHGQVVLLTGDPGMGKSILLTQLAVRFVRLHRVPLMYVSAEEGRDDVSERVVRLGVDRRDNIGLYTLDDGAEDLRKSLSAAERMGARIVVVDSVNVVRLQGGPSGTLEHIVYAAWQVARWAKPRGVSVFLIAHVNAQGDMSGRTELQHAVDTFVTYRGDVFTSRRVLASGKNRKGPPAACDLLMTAQGLMEIAPAEVADEA